jgi:2-octaprenyl-6-methoxyphenol hydroxylase
MVDPQPFEAQVAPTFDGRASAIAYSSFRMLTAIGAGARLEADAQRIEQILVTDGRSPGAASGTAAPFHLRFAAEEIAGRSGGEPLGYMVENRLIRAALAQAVGAAAISGAGPARVRSVSAGPARRRSLLEDGGSCAPRWWWAPRASLRGAGGGGDRRRRWDYRQTGVVATVRHAEPHGGVAHEYFLPGGPFAILPLTDNRASLVWTEPTAGGRPGRRVRRGLRGAPEAAVRRTPGRRSRGGTAVRLPAGAATGGGWAVPAWRCWRRRPRHPPDRRPGLNLG